MMNHVVYKEKAKKELIELIKLIRNQDKLLNEKMLDQKLDDILNHMFMYMTAKGKYKKRNFIGESEVKQGPVTV